MPVRFTYFPTSLPARRAEDVASFFLNPEIARNLLRAAEDASFGAVVVDDPAGALTNLDLSATAAAMTTALTVITTHWSGVMGPVAAAKQLASLSHKSDGRLALRISAVEEGGCAAASHVQEQKRAQEYLTLLRRLWLSDRAFDFEGPYYSIRGARFSHMYRFGRDIVIRMSGQTGAALDAAGRHADVFELEPASLSDLRALMLRVTAAASLCGRANKIKFALPITVLGTGVLNYCDYHPACCITLEDPERAAVSLIPFIEGGVSEFMIRGLEDVESIRWFGQRIVPLIRNSAARLVDDTKPAAASTWFLPPGATDSANLR
ncbi:LLM class flavin-dependent oxidoreductase [bacterium]|nr:LLM class flavin-dependent oxidoreductase [bacterium]